MKAARTMQTAPLYEAAYAAVPEVSVAPVKRVLASERRMATGTYREFLDAVAKEIGDGDTIPTQKLHNIRQDLDTAAQGMLKKYADLQPKDMRGISAIRGPVDSALKGVQGFADADKAFAGLSGPIEQAQREIVGQIANKRLPDVAGLGRQIFNAKSVDVKGLQAVRDRIIAENPGAWDSLVKWHLANTFDDATKGGAPGQVRNLGMRFVRRVWGDGTGKQAKLMRESLAHRPDVLESFETMMDVFGTMNRGMVEGSQTHPLMAQAGEAAAEAMSASPVMRAGQASRFVSADVGGRVNEFITEAMTGKYNTRFAEAMWEPNFQQAMKVIKKAGPKPQVAVQIMMRVLTRGVDAAVGGTEAGATALESAISSNDMSQAMP